MHGILPQPRHPDMRDGQPAAPADLARLRARVAALEAALVEERAHQRFNAYHRARNWRVQDEALRAAWRAEARRQLAAEGLLPPEGELEQK